MFDHQEELDQYLENIEALIKNKQYARLRDLFLPMEPADIALLLEEAGEEEMPLLYRLLPKGLAAELRPYQLQGVSYLNFLFQPSKRIIK